MLTEEELIRIESGYPWRNFPGSTGSLDCVNLRWKIVQSHGRDSITTLNQAILLLHNANLYMIVLYIVGMFTRDIPGPTMT